MSRVENGKVERIKQAMPDIDIGLVFPDLNDEQIDILDKFVQLYATDRAKGEKENNYWHATAGYNRKDPARIPDLMAKDALALLAAAENSEELFQALNLLFVSKASKLIKK